MTNNDVLRSIRHVLDISESTIADIFKLAEHKIDLATVSNFLKESDESGHLECNDNHLTLFLNGLITYRRGKSAHNPPLQNYPQLKMAFRLQASNPSQPPLNSVGALFSIC